MALYDLIAVLLIALSLLAIMVIFDLNGNNQAIDTISDDANGNATITRGSVTLTVNSGSFLGNITDTGSLVMAGTSTDSLTLTGSNNTYSGCTLIGDSIGLQGDIVTNSNTAFVVFNQNTTDGTFSGIIAGSRYVTKTGTNNLTITNTGTSYSGGTTISVGILTRNTALVFNQDTVDGTYSDIIRGSDSVTKLGGNRLTITGNHTYTGDTTASGGTLVINGSLASSTLTFSSSATLGGNSNLLNLVNITGHYTQNHGSFLDIKLDPSDLLNVTRNANINGGTI